MQLLGKLAEKLHCGPVTSSPSVAKLSVSGIGMRSHSGVAAKMFETLATEGINIGMISTSEIKVSCLVHQKYAELAVRSLHDAFGLGKLDDSAKAESAQGRTCGFMRYCRNWWKAFMQAAGGVANQIDSQHRITVYRFVSYAFRNCTKFWRILSPSRACRG